MKRKLNNRRDLLPEWLELIDIMMTTGEFLATLEDFDDNQSLIKFKRNALLIRQKLINFVKNNIEPIRLKGCVPDVKENEQDNPL